jgi:hypothetical protein
MKTIFKTACLALALVFLGQVSGALAQDKYYRDLYIKDVQDGKYKDDVKAIADLVGVSEQQLFDQYVAKEFRLDTILRCQLFAKELDRKLPDVLKIASKYAAGDDGQGKRWIKFYKDANIADEMAAKVGKQYTELAKTMLKNTHQLAAEATTQAAKVAATPLDPLTPAVVEKVTQRTSLPFGRVRDLVHELLQKKGLGVEDTIEAAVFAAKTRHNDKLFLELFVPEIKGNVIAALCKKYSTPAELKDEIALVAGYIKEEVKAKGKAVEVKDLLKETQAMRDTAAIISKRTAVPAAKVIELLRQIEGEEETARACVIAHVSGKDAAEIMKTRRTGGWLAVVSTYDLIEKMEEINETVLAIMTDYEKKMVPAPTTPDSGTEDPKQE